MRPRYIDRPGTYIVWLDPNKPSERATRLRELDTDLPGVNVLAIVVRTDDAGVSLELNRQTVGRRRPGLGGTIFLTAAERFSGVDEWLQYGRALSTERPSDLWLRVRSGSHHCLVPEGKTATVNGWLVHVFVSTSRECPGGGRNWAWSARIPV